MTMSKFTLRIEMGNEAMQTPEDVGDALWAVANRLNYGIDLQSGKILDYNGNTVGEWEFTE